MRLAKCAALAMLLAGCEREPSGLDLTGEQLMVHSVLRAGTDTVHVLVTRTLPEPVQDINAIGGFTQTRPVSGAAVSIGVGNATYRLTEAPSGFSGCASAFPFAVARPEPIAAGCYAAVLPARVRSDSRYTLRVDVPGAGSVTGETSVLQAPEILFPSERARVTIDPRAQFEGTGLVLLLRYRAPEGAAGVRPGLEVQRVFKGGAALPQARCEMAGDVPEITATEPLDSTTLVVRSFFCINAADPQRIESIVPDSVHARVVLAAFDSAFVDFSRAAGQQSALRERLQVHLTGALGAFTGAGVASRNVVLVPR